MSDKVLNAFHTTSPLNAEKIIKDGFIPSKGEEHWLGKGIYFYRDLYFAVQWGFIGVIKSDEIKDLKEYSEKCSIISVNLDFDKYKSLDLNTPDGYEILLKTKEIIKKILPEHEYERKCERGDAYFINILGKLEKNQDLKLLSQFDIICAEYDFNIYKKKRKLKSDFSSCKERQICVKNSQVISDIKKLDLDNDEVSNIFNLVKENRGEKYG